ncbi:MAG: hypothetical protein MOGMAGMI_01525 [Candidatus Omnitrophica bacterium]|nr:hypothetical protein [Candidatus Omnitrophota bacterium]
MILTATLTCPACGHTTREAMPEGYSPVECVCPSCASPIIAKSGECCVFCAYSDAYCPPRQRLRDGCCGG